MPVIFFEYAADCDAITDDKRDMEQNRLKALTGLPCVILPNGLRFKMFVKIEESS